MLDDIVLFLKIIQLGSFRKAAQFSDLSLSTVSKRISALEDKLNHRLMLRDPKNITLTEYGKFIYLKFQNLLMFSTRIDNLNKDIDLKGIVNQDTVTIYIGVNIGHSLINQHLDAFLTVNPNIKLNIIYQINPDSIESIKSNIILTSTFIEAKNYTTKLLCNQHLQFYCSKSYAEKYSVPQSIDDLFEHKIIGGISEEHVQVENISMHNSITGERIPIDVEQIQLKINNPYFMKTIGINSDAIFPCWASLCKDDLLTGAIIRVLPDWIIYTTQVCLTHKNDATSSEKLVINFLTECCSEQFVNNFGILNF